MLALDMTSSQAGTLGPKSTAFRSPTLGDIIAEAFFTGGNSLAAENATLFVSTRVDRPLELEVPASMVALAATAVGVHVEIVSYCC